MNPSGSFLKREPPCSEIPNGCINCETGLEYFRNTRGLFEYRERWLFLEEKPLGLVLSVYTISENAVAASPAALFTAGFPAANAHDAGQCKPLDCFPFVTSEAAFPVP
jgi:hypothetical protein